MIHDDLKEELKPLFERAYDRAHKFYVGGVYHMGAYPWLFWLFAILAVIGVGTVGWWLV